MKITLPAPAAELAQCVHFHIEVGSLDMDGKKAHHTGEHGLHHFQAIFGVAQVAHHHPLLGHEDDVFEYFLLNLVMSTRQHFVVLVGKRK